MQPPTRVLNRPKLTMGQYLGCHGNIHQDMPLEEREGFVQQELKERLRQWGRALLRVQAGRDHPLRCQRPVHGERARIRGIGGAPGLGGVARVALVQRHHRDWAPGRSRRRIRPASGDRRGHMAARPHHVMVNWSPLHSLGAGKVKEGALRRRSSRSSTRPAQGASPVGWVASREDSAELAFPPRGTPGQANSPEELPPNPPGIHETDNEPLERGDIHVVVLDAARAALSVVSWAGLARRVEKHSQEPRMDLAQRRM